MSGQQSAIEAAALRSDRFRLEREGDWQRLEAIVSRMEAGRMRRLSDDDILALPVLYRTVASSLSVARETSLDAATLAYLEGLVQRAWFLVYGPRRNTDTEQALARSRAARAKFEKQEIGVAEQKHRRDPDDDQELNRPPGRAALLQAFLRQTANPAGDPDQQQGSGKNQKTDEQQIKQQRTEPCTPARQCQRQDNPFGRDHLAQTAVLRANRSFHLRGRSVHAEGTARTRPKTKK